MGFETMDVREGPLGLHPWMPLPLIGCFGHGFLQDLPPLTFSDWRDLYDLDNITLQPKYASAFAFVVIIVVVEALRAVEALQFLQGRGFTFCKNDCGKIHMLHD